MTEIHAGAVLFDLDGTLADSTAVVERVWTEWAIRNGFEPERVLSVMHGRPAKETMLELAPELPDLEEQAARHLSEEEADTTGIVPVAGAMALLSSLPRNRWAIVTSCPPTLARVRMAAAGIPQPPVLVTSSDVRNGKPSPECYLLGASKLGIQPADCIVVEDAPAGVAAGLAAGMRVLALTTTHAAERVKGTWVLPNLSGVKAIETAGGITLTWDQER